MKYLITIALMLSVHSFADSYSKKSTIKQIGGIESRENGDFIILDGFTSAGTCPLSGGLVVARFRSDEKGSRTFSLGLAAKMAGKKITLSVNDDVKNGNGFCYVHSLMIDD